MFGERIGAAEMLGLILCAGILIRAIVAIVHDGWIDFGEWRRSLPSFRDGYWTETWLPVIVTIIGTIAVIWWLWWFTDGFTHP